MTPLVLATGCQADGCRLELTLTWLGDRYGQQLAVIETGSGRRLVLESCEGSADEPYPPSPPLQQILLHTTVTRSSAALGVGMAGTNHWSVSIEADVRAPRLVWDVACRCQSSVVARLASTFRWVDSQSTQAASVARPRPLALDLPDGKPTRVADDGLRTEFRPIQTVAEGATSAEAWTTVRWRFGWELSGSPGP